MIEESQTTPPEDVVVHVDGRSIPFRTWEHELMLRTAAWIAPVQGGFVAWVAAAGLVRSRVFTEAWMLAILVGLVGIGCVCVHSRGARRTLVAAGVVFLVLLASGGELPGSRTYGTRLDRLAPVAAGVAYALSGVVLLLWRWGLARDLLLVLSGAWLLAVGPNLLHWLWLSTTMSAPQSGISYLPLHDSSDLRSLDAGELLSLAGAWLLPPSFVFFTMLSRAGRSVFTGDTTNERLAPFLTLREGPPTARGWATVFVLVLTVFGTVNTTGRLPALIREFR